MFSNISYLTPPHPPKFRKRKTTTCFGVCPSYTVGHGPGQPALIDSTWGGGLDLMNSSVLLQLHLLCDSVNFSAWVTQWNTNVIKTMQLLRTKEPMWRRHASQMMSLPLGQMNPVSYDQLCDNTKNQPWGATRLLYTSCVISISQRGCLIVVLKVLCNLSLLCYEGCYIITKWC